MKSFISLVIIGLSLSVSTMMVAAMPQPEFEKVVAALERSDAGEVEKLLGAHTLNEEQKKELLEKATTIFAERQQNAKLLEKSYSNLGKIASGTVLSSVGTLVTAFLTWTICKDGLKKGIEDMVGYLTKPPIINVEKIFAYGLCSGPLVLGSGIYLMKKGWAHRITPVELYENAEKIKELLKGAPVG